MSPRRVADAGSHVKSEDSTPAPAEVAIAVIAEIVLAMNERFGRYRREIQGQNQPPACRRDAAA
jgi:xanthine/CO dehydrogenase XdhC/CoxF family maturation factor